MSASSRSSGARVDASNVHSGRLAPPLSKSDAQRAQILGWLTDRGVALAANADLPNDVRVMREGLNALTRARDQGLPVEIDCADGGAPFRLLLGQAAALPEGCQVRLTGSRRLGQRPHGALIASLRSTFGAHTVEVSAESFFPVAVTGNARASTPRFTLDPSESSQFATSLLLACAARMLAEKRAWTLEFSKEVASRGYFDLTLSWLERAGFALQVAAESISVASHRPIDALPPIPGDWSSLGYLLVCAWSTGSIVERVDTRAAHPDQAILEVLSSLKLELRQAAGETTVSGTPLSGLIASGAAAPDLLPTLAALACALPGPSTLHGTDILVGKESDRRAGIIELVHAAGGEARVEGDTLHLTPPPRLPTEFSFDTRSDHRLAMAAATLAVLARARLTLSDSECVTKSFPAFWRELAKLGVTIS